MSPDELLEEHGNVPAPPEDTAMETVIQKRSRRPETERNAKWLPTVLMWTFPILIIVVIYIYASSLNKPDPDQIDQTNLTNEQQDPTTAQTSPPASGGGVVAPTSSAGTEATTEPTAEPTPLPTPTPSPQSITVTPDGKAGKTTKFKVSAPAGSEVKVEISATGVSWLEVYKGENSKGEKLSFGNTAAGDRMSFVLGSEGMYIKSGYSPATEITVNGQVITDEKTSSRLLLNLDDGTGSETTQNEGTTDTTDQTNETGQ